MISIATAYAAMQSGSPLLCPPPHLDEGTRRDLAARIPDGHLGVFSSGSAGAPRCIVRTWASWQDSFGVVDARLGAQPGEVVGLTGPIWSTMVLFGALHALESDAIPRIDVDPRGDMDHVDVVHAVPTVALDLIDGIEVGRLAAPRLLVVAGARAPHSLWDRAAAVGVDVVEYFGSAETSFIAWRTQPGGFDLVPGIDVQIRDEVIWVRSPYLAADYLDGSCGPLRRDREWMTVGDQGALDERGCLIVRGRGDAAISTAGHTVHVDEVETVLADVPGVEQIAVVGIPHERYGEIVVAVFTGSASESALRTAANALPPAARPRRWVHREELPRLTGGKLDRARIREVAGP